MKEQTSNNPLPANDGNVPVIGSCFCGEQGVIVAFEETFCQKHNDELAASFEARMCDGKNNFL